MERNPQPLMVKEATFKLRFSVDIIPTLHPTKFWKRELSPRSFSSGQSLSHIFKTPCTAVRQASLSITNSRSLLKLMSIELVMLSNHLILCRPLLLLPSIPPSIRVFSNESALHIRWPKNWSFSFSVSPSKNTKD